MTIKYISTTVLAKGLEIKVKDLFQTLLEKEYIEKDIDSWSLTKKGVDAGGIVKSHHQYGSYIAWPENIKDALNNVDKIITATNLAEHFTISKLRINPILSELGLLEKSVKGWTVTKLGQSLGGKQYEVNKTGVPYVCWKENILTNKRLLETIQSIHGESTEEEQEEVENKTLTDGHYVRSRAEMLIDNWLYMSEIVHAYERKLPIEEDVYCDFYLPVGKVYIEYWGLENDERYTARKKVKIDIYNKYGFNLIEIDDPDIQNLDDVLPRKLLKFGIQAY